VYFVTGCVCTYIIYGYTKQFCYKPDCTTHAVFPNSSLKHTDHTNLDSNPHTEFCSPVKNKGRQLWSSYPLLLFQYKSVGSSYLEITAGPESARTETPLVKPVCEGNRV